MKLKNLSLTKLITFTATGIFLCIVLVVYGFYNQDKLPVLDKSSSVSQSEAVIQAATKPNSSFNTDDLPQDSKSSSSDKSSETQNSTSQKSSVSSVSASSSVSVAVSSVSASSQSVKQQPAQAVQGNGEYRAVWISYLEFQGINCSKEADFSAAVSNMFNNAVATGINTVIVQVRPFGDSLYKSSVFPSSDLITGTQGAVMGYDPLQVMIDEAKAHGLKIEAWVNPYRVKLSQKLPSALAKDNPAVVFQNSADKKDYVVEFSGGLYYNPAYPEVQDLIVRGTVEIVENYNIDAVQFDDYFYPTTDSTFDKNAYDKLAGGTELANWRRQNVNSLIKKVYSAIKSVKPGVRFGISPQGNNQNNYNSQYSDVKLWMSTPGYVDYIMPQLYWGFDYLTASGRTDYQFSKLAKEWAEYKRAPSVALYIGLGAYRIGVGDGGANDQSEWKSGKNLAKQVTTTREIQGISGFALFRYDNLYKKGDAQAVEENSSLKGVLK